MIYFAFSIFINLCLLPEVCWLWACFINYVFSIINLILFFFKSKPLLQLLIHYFCYIVLNLSKLNLFTLFIKLVLTTLFWSIIFFTFDENAITLNCDLFIFVENHWFFHDWILFTQKVNDSYNAKLIVFLLKVLSFALWLWFQAIIIGNLNFIESRTLLKILMFKLLFWICFTSADKEMHFLGVNIKDKYCKLVLINCFVRIRFGYKP